MINGILYLVLGLFLICYGILVYIPSFKRMLIKNEVVSKIIISVYSLAIGTINVMLGIYLVFNLDPIKFLIYKTYLAYAILLFLITYVVYELIYKIIKKNNYKILNCFNYIIFTLLVVMILFFIKMYSSPKIEINADKETIVIKDFLSVKNIPLSKLTKLDIEDTMVETTSDYFAMNNGIAFKGYFKMINGDKVYIQNRLKDARSIVLIVADNKIYQVGFKDKSEAIQAVDLMNTWKVHLMDQAEVLDFGITEPTYEDDADGHGSTPEESIEDFLSKHPEVSREELIESLNIAQ